MEKIKAIIIDDEPLARKIIAGYLAGEDDIALCGECENGFDAMKMISATQPDLLFLDIQMPKVDGFELLEVMPAGPEVIFTTAYDQYAIRAFENNAVDYLLKPFSRERFQQALEKVRQRMTAGRREGIHALQQQLDDSKTDLRRVVARVGSKIHVIPVESIRFVEAQDDYVMIHSTSGNFLKEKTMKYFEQALPQEDFLRIHRGCILNLQYLQSVEAYAKDTHLAILKSGEKLRVSAEGYKRLREKLS